MFFRGYIIMFCLKGICYFCIDFDCANITVQSKLYETSLIHFCEENVATFFERPKLKPVFSNVANQVKSLKLTLATFSRSPKKFRWHCWRSWRTSPWRGVRSLRRNRWPPRTPPRAGSPSQTCCRQAQSLCQAWKNNLI